jgi:hypothetical protein
LYKAGVSPDALAHSSSALERLWTSLKRTSLDDIAQGMLH